MQGDTAALLTPKNIALGGLFAATTVPIVLAESVEWHERNMTFISPVEGDTFVVGQQVNLTTQNYGLASLYHLRTSELYLLNDKDLTLATPTPFKTFEEWSFLGKVDRNYGVIPADSRGNMTWVVPDVPDGIYRLKYVSGWSISREWAEFSAISPRFSIKSK